MMYREMTAAERKRGEGDRDMDGEARGGRGGKSKPAVGEKTFPNRLAVQEQRR